MSGILIVGDSTLDNAPYVGEGGIPVKGHLDAALADLLPVDFRALDGALIADVTNHQLPRPESGASYDACVVSVGGNNALGHVPLLEAPDKRTLFDTALLLRKIQDPFRADYREMLARARAVSKRTLVLVIYRGRFQLDRNAPPGWQEATSTLLSIFTDVMAEEARAAGADVVDLRNLFTDEVLYANPIEPSDAGGALIVEAITEWLLAELLA